jgi:PAS domain S-box-containing protein
MDKELLKILIVGLLAIVVILSLIITRLHKKTSGPGGKPASSKLAANLRDEKLRSSIILEAIEDGVVLVDGAQTIQLFNPGAAKITGWKADEAKGLNWRSVFKFVDKKGQELPDPQNPVLQLFEKGETIRNNNAYITTKSGKTITLSLVITPLLDEQKNVTGAVGIFRDVSQERQEEAQRAEFISTASHEMRTPVAAIEGYLALALNDKVSTIDSRGRGYLEKAHASTQHLGKLFQDLLTSAKAEDGRLTNHPSVIEFGAFLEQIVNDLKFSAEKKGLFLEFLVGNNKTIDASNDGGLGGTKTVRPLYYTHADPDRIREVITNIFDNAVKYTEAGKISIGLTGDDRVVQFYVRDTGHGIPREDIPHMFQKFYRVDNSATRTIGGTGLGLFICRKIVELYGGRIWVESELEKGSTFFINLPRLSTQKAEEMQAQEAKSATLAPISSLAGS